MQKIRDLELLLVTPWTIGIEPGTEFPLDTRIALLVPNPVSFVIQKLLIHERRPRDKRAQDVLCIHDTLELFGGALDDLRTLWTDQLRTAMPHKKAKRAVTTARALFAQVTDTIREAARIPQDRRLPPEVVRAACAYGLTEILGEAG